MLTGERSGSAPSVSVEDLRKAYRQWPHDLAKAFFRAQEVALLREVTPVAPAVDLGCGTGSFASLLGYRLDAGVDMDRESLRAAERSGAYRACVRADLHRLPFGSGTVSTVIANSVLEHVVDVRTVFAEIYRVLGAGGRLYFTAPTHRKRAWLMVANAAELAGRGDLAETYRREFDTRWRHLRYLRPEQWRSLLAEAGFAAVQLVEYESRRTSELVDTLNNLEIRLRPGSAPLAGLRSEAVSDWLARLLVEVSGPLAVSEGANVFCSAAK